MSKYRNKKTCQDLTGCHAATDEDCANCGFMQSEEYSRLLVKHFGQDN